MPGKFEIMRAVREGLNSLPVTADVGNKKWTRAVKTELCKIGRRFGYRVYARKNEVDKAYRNDGEWLYDVTWLEYVRDYDPLVLAEAPLIAECEWHGRKVGSGLNYRDQTDDDFEKLLLAREGVRLMVFNGWEQTVSTGIAERLAGRVREFNGSRAEDAWLLASWEWNDDEEKGWSFRYFTIEMNAAIPFAPPSGS